MMNQPIERVFLIVNRFAGHRDRIRRELNAVFFYLKSRGCDVQAAWTEYPAHATRLASEAVRNGYQLVVAVGGDGTVNEVAQGLAGTTAVLGILPAGSGNGLARELGMSMRLVESSRTLLEGTLREIDVCRFNNHRFLCTSGIGFDAQVAESMNRSKHRKFFRYLLITLQESFRFKPFDMEMLIDGIRIKKPLFMATFANASQFGNNARIAPHARMDDGWIDVTLIHPFHKIWLPLLGIGLYTRLISQLPFIESFRAKKIEIISADTPLFHYDGEPGRLELPTTISIDNYRVKVMAKK